MTFPDQSHINRVRDALHLRSGNGASVMVGSGFSRNAIPTGHISEPMPTWQGVANYLHSVLYPSTGQYGSFAGSETVEGNVRIAQEYEAAFGRGALHDALQRMVRDGQYGPGPAHTRLLRLPWNGIFTTNWDTLLERARENVPEHRYSVVSSMEQIPMANRPRIFKLHGSLPSQFPLIVTEEDYRTYPARFAPFVNTVQQAMMETVFLLIGFSGDDPNFINWSGWVRDNLGNSAPKIYLAGWLGLSQHRRRMLENHNVVPIDLAQHPQAQRWPENSRHEHATDWLLYTLENGRPYDVTNWPTPPNQERKAIPDHLQPVATTLSSSPLEEPIAPSGDTSPDSIRDLTNIWRHNRLMYPGWLTIPYSKRERVEQSTYNWGQEVLQSLPLLTPIERLNVVREMAWRAEVLLVPFDPCFETAMKETLDEFDCLARTIDGDQAPGADWAAIRENWRSIAAVMATSARFRSDRDAFEEWIKALEPFRNEDMDIQNRICHELCLRALYDLDFQLVDQSLTDWKTNDCDPAWMMRKSAILWEAGHSMEAETLLNHALVSIRAMPDDELNLGGHSRESWAVLVALGWDNLQSSLKRLRELVPLRCDVFGERQSVSEGFRLRTPKEEAPSFDVNRRRRTTLHLGDYDPQVAAYRAIRLSEVAGLPPVATGYAENVRIPVTVWADIMKQAACEIADHDLELAIRLVLRVCHGSTDQSLEKVLTRTRIASLTSEQTENLARTCLAHMNREGPDSFQSTLQPRRETAIEVLSRLVVRTGPSVAEHAFDNALKFLQDSLTQKVIWEAEIQHLVERTWEALPRDRRSHRAIDLLNTPIAGMNDDPPILGRMWRDAGEYFTTESTALIRSSDNEGQWRSAIDLVLRGLTSNAEVRRRASIRMIHLVHSSLLTEEEYQEIAQALWNEAHTPPGGLPTNIYPDEWRLISLPEPRPRLASERFVARWLPDDDKIGWQHKTNVEILGDPPYGLNHDTQDVDSRLWQVGNAMMGSIRQLKLSDTEKVNLQRLVAIWACANVPVVASPPEHLSLFDAMGFMWKDHVKDRIRAVAGVLPTVIGEVGLPPEMGEKLYVKMREMDEHQISAMALAPSVVMAVPGRASEVATAMRIGITSDDPDLVVSAMQGLCLWLKVVSDVQSCTPRPPDDLVREIGIAIASRRSTALPGALATARWIFDDGDQIVKEAILQLVLQGLSYLAEELRYNRKHEDPEEIPFLRLLCAELAVAMAKDGQAEQPEISCWLSMAREDPLPEVRNAVEGT